MTTTTPHDVDPTGDLILVVGPTDNSQSIRVCSQVLKLASSVFAAMLSPRFAEGQAAGHKDWTISLPEDDAEAMLAICRALHFIDTASENIAFTLIEKVASLCDKYDLAVALRGWSELALKVEMASMRNDEIGCARFLSVSQMPGCHEAFWMASRRLLYHCSAQPLFSEAYGDYESVANARNLISK